CKRADNPESHPMRARRSRRSVQPQCSCIARPSRRDWLERVAPSPSRRSRTGQCRRRIWSWLPAPRAAPRYGRIPGTRRAEKCTSRAHECRRHVLAGTERIDGIAERCSEGGIERCGARTQTDERIDKAIWIGGRDSKRRVERAIQPYQRRIRASTLARDDIGCALVLSRQPNLLDVD